MSWDFSLEAGNRINIERQLKEGLKGGWKLKGSSQNRLWEQYQKEGFTMALLDNLTTCICLELGLYECAILEQLEFKTLFERRSKQGNYAMADLFYHWNRYFCQQEGFRVATKNASAILEKKDLVELVYWIEICCTLLAKEEVWLVNPAEDQFLLEQAIEHCNRVKDYEEMKVFGFFLPMHQYLKEEIEKSPFDLFYWCNSY